MKLHVKGFITDSFSGACTNKLVEDLPFDYFGKRTCARSRLLDPAKIRPVSVKLYFKDSAFEFSFYPLPSKSKTLG